MLSSVDSVVATNDAGNVPGVTPAQSTSATNRPRTFPGLSPAKPSCVHCCSTCERIAATTASYPSSRSIFHTALSRSTRCVPPVYAFRPPCVKITSSNRRSSWRGRNARSARHLADFSIALAARRRVALVLQQKRGAMRVGNAASVVGRSVSQRDHLFGRRRVELRAELAAGEDAHEGTRRGDEDAMRAARRGAPRAERANGDDDEAPPPPLRAPSWTPPTSRSRARRSTTNRRARAGTVARSRRGEGGGFPVAVGARENRGEDESSPSLDFPDREVDPRAVARSIPVGDVSGSLHSVSSAPEPAGSAPRPYARDVALRLAHGVELVARDGALQRLPRLVDGQSVTRHLRAHLVLQE